VGLKDAQRTAVTSAVEKAARATETAAGEITVSATWTGGADLDVAVIDPSGRRAGAVTRMKSARVEGSTSRDHETLALSSSDAGSFLVEIVRASSAEASTPVSGTVTMKAFGQTQVVPFTLTGPRAQVGRVDVRWDAELVPLDGTETTFVPPPTGLSPFDRGAAAGALASVGLRHCNAFGQVGTGHVMVTFEPTGRVAEVVVDDGIFSGTPAGRCVQTAFFNAAVIPFAGAPVKVGKSFSLGQGR
jgi:hypothetical protein